MASVRCGTAAIAHVWDKNGSIWDVDPLTVPPALAHTLASSPFSSVPVEAASGSFRETHGCEFRQLFQDFPALTKFYTAYEAGFNTLPFVRFAETHMYLPFLLCAGYIVFILVGMKIMKNQKAFELRAPLVLWNMLLSGFSLIGFLRTAPHLLYYTYSAGVYDSICAPAEPAYGHGAVGLWTMLFIYSKVPELIDTVFIVFKKKKLIFLHWYHHITVLLYCWHSYATRSSAGLYFVAMNFGVHAIMYFYYGLTAMRIRVKWDWIVTILQISQMFVGVAVCAGVYLYHKRGLTCEVTRENYIAGLVMYASYFALFVWFAVEKYIFPSAAPKPSAAKPKQA